MTVKSLIIFALIASLGRVFAAPLAGGHLGARGICQGLFCSRFIPVDGHYDLSRRLAQFGGDNVTLSSSPPGVSTPAGSSTSSTMTSVYSYPSMSSLGSSMSSGLPTAFPQDSSPTPSSVLSVDPSSVGPFVSPSTSPADSPQATLPGAGQPTMTVTLTVTSTVFSTGPPQPTPSSDALGPSSDVPSSTLSGGPLTSTPVDLVPGGDSSPSPVLSQPAGFFSSSSDSLSPTPSPSVINLNPDPAGEPTPSPTSSGIVFLPPS